MKHPHIYLREDRYGPADIWIRWQQCLFCDRKRYPVYKSMSVAEIERWTFDVPDDSILMTGSFYT